MDKSNKKNFRKIQKVKRSYYVTLPIAYVRELGWDKNRDVVVRKTGRKLIIERAGSGSSVFSLEFSAKARTWRIKK